MRCQNSDLVVAKLCMCPMRGQTNTLTSCALLNALGSIQGSGTTSLSPTATSTGTVIAAASSATAPGATIWTPQDGVVADRHAGRGSARPADAAMSSVTLSAGRSEEHTSALQSLMRSSYAVFCLTKNKT